MVERETRALVVGLEVRDRALYARYRAQMAPLLERHGGRFGYDFEIAEVLRSEAGEPINRVFTIVFPDAQARQRFFADAAYQRIRAELFEPSVGATTILAQFDP